MGGGGEDGLAKGGKGVWDERRKWERRVGEEVVVTWRLRGTVMPQ